MPDIQTVDADVTAKWHRGTVSQIYTQSGRVEGEMLQIRILTASCGSPSVNNHLRTHAAHEAWLNKAPLYVSSQFFQDTVSLSLCEVL